MERRVWSREGRRGRGVGEREDKEENSKRVEWEGREGENRREGRGGEVRGEGEGRKERR